MHHEIEQYGFAIIPAVIGAKEQRELISFLGPLAGAGRRGLLSLSPIANLARSSRLLDLVRPHVPLEPFPVRAVYFDKSSAVNWMVPWHQDLTLAFRSRVEVSGFGPWSVKDKIPHVQPPVTLLEQMLTVRLHFDDADDSNGALRVLPGSHRLGRLSAEHIKALRSQQSGFVCAVSAGDVLLMRPLLLHTSKRSTSTRNRRVLHIEYAALTLPVELNWHEAT